MHNMLSDHGQSLWSEQSNAVQMSAAAASLPDAAREAVMTRVQGPSFNAVAEAASIRCASLVAGFKGLSLQHEGFGTYTDADKVSLLTYGLMHAASVNEKYREQLSASLNIPLEHQVSLFLQ